MSPIKKNIIFSLIFIGTIIVFSTTLISSAQAKSVATCDIKPFSFATGITPERFHEPGNIAMTVGWCDFLQIISNFIGLLYRIIIPIIMLMFVFGGAIFITAGGNEGSIKKGQAFLKSAIIGLIIVLLAGVIVGTIIRGLGVAEGTTLMPWLF